VVIVGTEKKSVEAGASPETAGDSAPPANDGWRRIVLAMGIVLGGVGLTFATYAVIAYPRFEAARDRANQRACYANQKTLAGAIEMYQLDFDTQVQDIASVTGALVSEGYLMQFPKDPGGGSGSEGHYLLVPGPELQVRCTVHGSVWRR
jgi:hypothetical protein